MANNLSLRTELQNILDIFHHIGLDQQATVIHELANEIPHLIQLISLNGQYTCYEYVLGFWQLEEYKRVARACDDIFAGKEFVQFMLAGKLQEIDKEHARPGDIIFYFDSEVPQHAGMVAPQGRVRSKWGKGNLWEHEVFEVPQNYGNQIKYFSTIAPGQAAEFFKEWARIKGADKSLL